MTRKIYSVLVLATMALILSACSNMQSSSNMSSSGSLNAPHTVAINGYDPVAYFNYRQALRGNSDMSYTYAGTTWYFATNKDKDLFSKNPTRYMPQYGGYSAYDMAQGRITAGDPNYWNLINGKLYLNGSSFSNWRWKSDISGNIAKANSFWRGRGVGNSSSGGGRASSSSSANSAPIPHDPKRKYLRK